MSPSQANIQLTGRLLLVARVAWVICALVVIGSTLVALPLRLNDKPNLGWADWTPAESQVALQQLGWSVEGVTRFTNWSNSVLPLAYLVLALFIFWRKSADLAAYLLSLLLLLFLPSFDLLGSFHPAWLVVRDVTASFTSALTWVVFFIFPDGRFVPRWMRWVALAMAAFQFWRLIQPELYDRYVNFAAVLSLICIPTAQLYRYFRMAGSVQRQQIKWVVFGLVLGVVPLVLILAVFAASPALQRPTAQGIVVFVIGNVLYGWFLISLPLSFTLAILRSRLWDIDLIIRRTLVYGVLTTTLVLAYFGSVVVLQSLFRALTRQGQSPIVTVASTLLIAVLFTPLRRRIQAVIDRRFYRNKYNASQTLAAFATTARDEVELDRLRDELLNVVGTTMQPAHLSLWLKSAPVRGNIVKENGE